LHEARDTLSHTVAARRAERTALWQDSTFFQDSFFAPDNRMDSFTPSEFGALTGGPDANGAHPHHRQADDDAADDSRGSLMGAPRSQTRH
jgi:hypothetical protein